MKHTTLFLLLLVTAPALAQTNSARPVGKQAAQLPTKDSTQLKTKTSAPVIKSAAPAPKRVQISMLKTVPVLEPVQASTAKAVESGNSIPVWLTSAVIAALVSAGFNWVLKDKEYKNDYYKKVIDKRIKAIEALEAFNSMFSSNYRRADGKLYHSVFLSNDVKNIFNERIDECTRYAVWYRPEIISKLLIITGVIAHLIEENENRDLDEKINASIMQYDTIRANRNYLASHIRQDMASLYNVEDFFKSLSLIDKAELAR